MSKADQYAQWIIDNADKKGTEEFNIVAQAYQEAKGMAIEPVDNVKPDTGFTGAFSAGKERLKGDIALLAGKTGLMSLEDAERYKREKDALAQRMFKPTEEGWSQAPLLKFRETLGGSLPYMAAPLVAGVGAKAIGVGAGVGLAGAGLASLGQFTGSNLARQMETGKTLEETSLGKAAAAAAPQTALDLVSLRMIPVVGKLFGAAGKEVTPELAKKIAEQGMLRTTAAYGAGSAKLAGIEGATEVGQQFLERLQAGLNISDQQARDEYFDSFIGGAVLGGTLAVPGTYLERGAIVRQGNQMEQEQKRQAMLDRQRAEQEAQQKAALEQRQQIQETQQRLGVPETLALPAPDKKYVEPSEDDPLFNPLGRFKTTDLSAKEIAEINQRRQAMGKSRIGKTFSIEDLADVFTPEESKTAEGVLGRLVASRTGFQAENDIPPNVLNLAAQQRGISTDTQGFRDFLERTTGTSNLEDMSPPQRLAVKQALDNIPVGSESQVLQAGITTVKHYTPEQYTKTIGGINKEFAEVGDKPNGRESVLKQIEKYSGLTRRKDQQRLLDQALLSGDLERVVEVRNVNGVEKNVEMIQKPTPRKELPAGMDIRKETFKQGETPDFYEIRSGSRVINQKETAEEAEEELVIHERNRQAKIVDLEKQINSLQAGIQQREAALLKARSLGEDQGDQFFIDSAKAYGKDQEANQKIATLRQQQQQFAQPIQIVPVGTRALTQNKFTYYEKGKPTVKFDKEEQAEAYGISRLNDQTLQQIIDSAPAQKQTGRVKRYVDLAQKELDSRTGKKPEGIEITTKQGLEGAEERLEKLGLVKKEAQEKLTENIDAFRKSLLPTLKRFGLEKIGLNIVDSIENGKADGSYVKNLITLALDAKDVMGTLRHESIHALKELGGFTDAEWKVLTNKAKTEWVQKFITDRGLFKRYQDQYKEDYGNLKGFDEYIQEEAIAEAFRFYSKNKLPAGMIGNIIYRLQKFFEALRNSLNKLGFTTANEIFSKVEEGGIKTLEPVKSEKGIKYDKTRRIDMDFKQVTERIPELQEGMAKLEAGEITAKQYDKLVNKYKTIMPYDFVPKPATRAEAVGAIEDKETYGVPSKTLKNGHPVGLRLDIPAYSRYGVWVPTIHEQASGFGAGKKIGHESVAAVTDATFGMSEKAAASIAGGKPKGTIATIKGSYKKISEKEAVARAEEALNDPTWTQVGMDPERHSYFYDRKTTEPVVSADEVIQIGPLVLAKNAVYAPKSQFKYSLRAEEKPLLETSSLENIFKFARDNSDKFKRNRDLKIAIQDQVLTAAEKEGIDLSSTEDETTKHLVKAGIDDAIYALKSNANAVGWYDKTVAKALNVIALMHPEIKTDPDAKFAFTWALAVTSNGIKVDKNFQLAEQAYKAYKKTGKMPTNLSAGEAQQAINNSLELFNLMTDKYGIDNMRKFMATEFTVKQIERITNLEVGGEFADTRVLGASILGPKIGNGFFSNLNGIFDQLTMDRWLMRTWGRWTGSLIEDNARLINNKRGEMNNLIQGLVESKNKQTRERFEQVINKPITEKDFASETAIDALATAINKASIKPANRSIFNKSNLGETIRKTSNSLVGYIDAQKEAPAGPAERNYIREVFSGILDGIRKRGYPNMTMSDLQALLWYPERRLYDAAKESNVSEGYTDDEAPDYANAAAKLARLNGIPESKIKDVEATTEKEYADRTAAIQRDFGKYPSKIGSEGRDVGFAGKERRHFITRGIIRSYRERNEETPNAYKRNGGTDGKGFRVLGQKAIAEFKPVIRFKNALLNADVDTPTFYELDSNGAGLFQKSIASSKKGSQFGAAVYVYPEEEYANMRTFLTKDGKAGFALKGDDIVSVFSTEPHVGGVNGIMQLAVQEGGRRLDAFDTVLPDLYYNNGFKIVARLGWNDEYKPDNWDKEVFLPFNRGEPDVVFMVYDPTYNKAPTKTDGVKVNEYDQGIEQQVKSIEAGGKFSLRAEEVVPESKYSLALGNIDPTTFLVSEKNPNNTGNLAFMPGSAPFAKYPIRLPVGTHDDISDQGYGANHILRRMQTDVKRRPAEVTKERLEDLILHIEDLGKRFKRVYRSGPQLVLYDPLTDDAMFVKPLSDHYEVQSMYSDARIPTKYGDAAWSGKNIQPPEAKKFEEKQRGILVQASKEGRVEPKPIGIKVKRVITPNQIEAEAEKKVEPTKGTLSLKKKMSLKAPDTPEVDAFMNRIEGESKIVDENGTPKIMYHGTARDITEFKPKQANAIFLTDSPRFAEGFTDASEAYMVKELKNRLSSEELQKLAKEADKRAKKSGDLPEEEMARVLKEQLPSRANIIPVYVYANKPFDFQNDSDVEEVLNNLETESLAVELDRRALKNGNWSEIEKPRFQKAIKAAGFDGFYVIEGGQKNLAVYDSSQIKSAFNVAPTAESKDIRYSFNVAPESHTKLEQVSTYGKTLTDTITSIFKMFKDPEERIKTRIAFIDPNSGLARSLQDQEIYKNGILRGDLLARAKAQTINLIRNGLQTGIPVVNSDGSVIIEIDEVNNLANSRIMADRLNDNYYVKGSELSGRAFVAEVARALRGKEIMEEDRIHNAKTGENRNREKQVSQKQIDWAEQQLKNVPEMQEIFDIWKKVNTGLINLWESVGLFSKAEADTYRAKKFYVSLAASNTDLETMMESQLGFTAAGLKSTPKVKKLEGAEYLRDKSGKVVLDENGNPVPLKRNIWENIDKQYASMLAGAYQNQVRKVAVTQLIDAGAARIPTKKRNGVDVGNPDAEGINLRYKDPTNPFADSKGVVHVIVDNATDLSAFESMHYELGPVLKFFGGATNILRAGALLNPMFWIRQLIRDPIHASIVANGGIVTPFHSAKEYINVLRKNSEEAKILASRGVIGQYDSTLDLYTFLDQVGTEKVNQGNVQKAFHKLMQMHEASDAATRVAIFKKEKQSALDKGMTEEEAVNYAVMKSREAINFLVHGNSKILNAARQMIPFLSASITSLDTVYRAATGYNLPASEKEAAKKLFKQRAALMFGASIAYAMLMQDDEEYQKQPNYVKDNNWLIKNPIGEGFLKVAVPYEVGFLFKVVPEVAIRYAYGNDTGKEMVKAYKDGLLHNLPTGGVPVPQALKPAFETIVNYSFFTGNPVESIGESRLPVEMRGRNASETAKFLSGAGLGFVGLSPSKIDNLVQGYFAEAGTFMFGLADQLVYTLQGTEGAAKNLEKQPFFKAFMTDPNADKAVANFFDIQQTANRTAQGFNELKNSGRLEEAREMVEDEEKKMLIASAPTLRKFSENMTKVRRQIEIVKGDQSRTPEERRELINKLTAQYNIIAQQGVKAADKLGIR
jgi:hypothetical protein